MIYTLKMSKPASISSRIYSLLGAPFGSGCWVRWAYQPTTVEHLHVVLRPITLMVKEEFGPLSLDPLFPLAWRGGGGQCVHA